MAASDLIREARLRAGLTQRQLAQRIGTAQSSVARWESGRVEPSFEAVAALVRACGLELRVSLAAADPGEASLIERNLALSPDRRLDQLLATLTFIADGREAMAGRRD